MRSEKIRVDLERRLHGFESGRMILCVQTLTGQGELRL